MPIARDPYQHRRPQAGRAIARGALLFFSATAAPANAALTDGLVAHYPFDGNADDQAAAANHGSLSGDVSFRPGAFGQAAYLDGDADYITVPDAGHLDFGTGDFSIAVWLSFPPQSQQSGSIIQKRVGALTIQAFVDHPDPGGDLVRFTAGTQEVFSQPAALNDGRWHYFTFVRASGTLSIHVDGSLVAEGTFPADDTTNAADLLIGRNVSDPDSQNYEGLIDEFRLYNRALTAAEIRELSGRITVTSLGDDIADDGVITLREAITAAKTDAPSGDAPAGSAFDQIDFDPALTASGAATVLVNTGLPDLAGAARIVGPGAHLLTVRRAAGSPEFRLFTVAAGAEIELRGMTITNGLLTSGGGGGVASLGALTLREVSLVGNRALNGAGLWAFNDAGGVTTVDRSLIAHNRASGDGAAIYVSAGHVEIEASTLSANTAGDEGGALYLASAASARVTNSTLSGNSAGDGAAIRHEGLDEPGSLVVRNSTVTGNTATSGAAAATALSSASRPLALSSSIVAGNTSASGTSPDLVAQPDASLGFNLVGVADTSGVTLQGTDLGGTSATPLDPLLGALADNGGPAPTLSRSPRAGSPALDAGHSGGLTLDGRGGPRARDIASVADAVGGDGADIGAVEAVAVLSLLKEGRGALSVSPSQDLYEVGETVQITATPERFYAFVQWSDTGIDSPRTVTLELDNTLTAQFAPTTALEWHILKEAEEVYGGDNQEHPTGFVELDDGGFAVAATSVSGVSGNKATGNRGSVDRWILRLDAAGNVLWEKNYGGADQETASRIVPVSTGGFVQSGSSNSGATGDKSSATFGGFDHWILRLDEDGALAWQQAYGGSGNESENITPIELPDGFLFAGNSESGLSGNRGIDSFGGHDLWIVRTDLDGDKLWERVYGGSEVELQWDTIPVSSGGFLLFAASTSPANGNKTTGNAGSADFWLLRLDDNGDKVWEASFGGGGIDNARRVIETRDGGFLLGGDSNSGAGGPKSAPNYGFLDYWIIKVDAVGTLEWEKSFGGDGTDVLRSVKELDGGGFLLAGTTTSGVSGNKATPQAGLDDWWLIEVDAQGDKVWERTFGGGGVEEAREVIPLADGSMMVVGSSSSDPGGDKGIAAFNSSFDIWLVRLRTLEFPVGTPDILVDGLFQPTGTLTANGSLSVTLATTFPDGSVRYTLDGSTPDGSSTLYSGPFTVSETATIRAIAFSADMQQSAEADPVQVVFTPAIVAGPRDTAPWKTATATLTVEAAGTAPLTFQWRKGGVPIGGATDPTLTLTATTIADSGAYDVVVSNAHGSATSDPATLTVVDIDADTALSTPFRPGEIPDGLVGYWKLNELSDGTGAVERQDGSGRDNHLTDNNTVPGAGGDYWGTGEVSADLARSNLEFFHRAHADLDGLAISGDGASMTIAAWVRPESLSASHTIVSKNDGGAGYQLLVDNSNNIWFYVNGSGTSWTGGPVKAGRWSHLAVTFDEPNDRVAAYLDGNLLSAQAQAAVLQLAASRDFYLGSINAGGADAWDGRLKDVAVWDRALTPLEIKSLGLGLDLEHLAFRPRDVSVPPTAWWKLDEVSDGTAPVARADSSGNGHHLTDNSTVESSGGFVSGSAANLETGNSEFLSVADHSDFDFGAGDFSMVTWIRFESEGDRGIACQATANSDRWFWDHDGGGSLRFFSQSPDTQIEVKYFWDGTPDTWYHVGITRSSDTFTIWIDGVAVFSKEASGSVVNPAASFDLGRKFGSTFFGYLDASLSDFALWNGYALTADEVATLARAFPLQRSGVVSYWPLDEASGDALDAIGSNDLTDAPSGVPSVEGTVGRARDFERDGPSHFLSRPDATSTGLDLETDLTLLAWVTPESLPAADMDIIDKHSGSQGYVWRVQSNNRMTFAVNNFGFADGDTALVAGETRHLSVVHDGARIAHFRDGIGDGSTDFTTLPADTTTDFNLGRNPQPNDYFDGVIDEVLVAARHFREEEIKAAYIHGLTGRALTAFDSPVPPTIAVQPVDVTVAEGFNLSHLLDATGTGPFRVELVGPRGVAAVDGLRVTLPAVAPADAGSYQIVVSNAYGATTSAAFTLTVVPATTFTVDSLADTVAADGEVTLREAITAANTDAPSGDAPAGGAGDVITFDPGLFPDGSGARAIHLQSALPGLTSALRVVGPGADRLTVRRDAGGDYRIFTVGGTADATLQGLTASNGRADGGAGILVEADAALELADAVVRANHSTGDGGGVLNNGRLSLVRSTVAFNRAERDGAGLANFGQLTATNTTISTNNLMSGGDTPAGQGGGLFASGNGTATLSNCTVVHNSFMEVHYDDGADAGGGIAAVGTSEVTATSCIIAGNRSGTWATDDTSAHDVYVQGGTFTSGGFNLVGVGDLTGNPVTWQASDQTGTGAARLDPLLRSLAPYGGSTLVHALQPGSPAVDAGTAAGSTLDGRGRPRTDDLAGTPNAAGGDGTDTGAAETPARVRLLQARGGTVAISPLKETYEVGEMVQVTATPDRFFQFDNWIGGAAENPRTVTLGHDETLEAVFAETTPVPLERTIGKQWERVYGGTSHDRLSDIDATADQNFLLVGYSASQNGDKSEGLGGTDIWIVKIDPSGNILWERSYGGDSTDWHPVAQATADGGFIIGGRSQSTPGTGTKTAPHHGDDDAWVFSIDSTGTPVWDRSFGVAGSGDSDDVWDVRISPDGGVVAGGSAFIGLNASKLVRGVENPGDLKADVFLNKLNGFGDIEWQRAFGSLDLDYGREFFALGDGGFIVTAGHDGSASGHRSVGGGGTGSWIFRVDGSGRITRQTQIRPMLSGAEGYPALTHANGDLYLGGNGTNMGADAALVRINEDELTQDLSPAWSSLYIQADTDEKVWDLVEDRDVGGVLTAGIGGTRGWVFAVDEAGVKSTEVDFRLGGTNVGRFDSILATEDGFLVGGTIDPSTDPAYGLEGRGGDDYWLVKFASRLAPAGTPLVEVDGFFNPGGTSTGTGASEVVLSSTFTPSGGSIRYTLNGSAPSATSTLYGGPFMVADTATLRAIAFSSDMMESAEADPVELVFAPAISVETSGKTVWLSGTAVFSVGAAGTVPLVYQWRKDGVAIPGANGSSLAVTDAQPGDAGDYDVVVTNAHGTATSAAATLTVIGVDVASGGTFRPGDAAVAPTAWWKLDDFSDGSTPVMRLDSIGSLHLSDNEMTPSGAGVVSARAADFTPDEFLFHADDPAFDFSGGVWSVSCWINVDGLSGRQTVLSQATSGNDYMAVTVEPIPRLRINVFQGGGIVVDVVSTEGVISPGTWHHCVFTEDGNDWRIYVDGVDVTASVMESSNRPANYTARFQIAQSDVIQNSAKYTGRIEDYAIWNNYRLTEEEIGFLGSAADPPEQPAISSPPAAVTAGVGAPASLSVTATGTAPLVYIWEKDGAVLHGETGASLDFGPTGLTDSGVYRVTVGNAYGTAVSAAVTVLIEGTHLAGARTGTLTAAESPYSVDGDVSATDLTIEPGVTLLFRGPHRFDVSGTFSAAGTAGRPVRFRPGSGAPPWDGIRLLAGSSPVLENVRIEGTGTTALDVQAAGAALRRVTVSGVTGADPAVVTTEDLVMEDCTVADNTITAPGAADGGGIRATNCDLTLRRCLVSGNTLSGGDLRGAGVFLTGGILTIEDSRLAGNRLEGTGDVQGGGACASDDTAATLILARSVVEDNTARSTSAGDGDPVTATGGGGVWASQLVASASVFRANEVDVAGGTSTFGGGGWAKARAEVKNCLFVDNTAPATARGGGLYVHSQAGPSSFIRNVTMVGCSPDAVRWDYNSNGSVSNVILADSGPAPLESSVPRSYSLYAGAAPTGGNRDDVPVFTDTARYLLDPASPGVDGGDPDPARDDTDFPPSRGTARNDMGAYGGPGAADLLAATTPGIQVDDPGTGLTVGDTLTLSATAFGAGPFIYQWRRDGVDVPGATGAELMVDDAGEADAGLYTVVVRNAAGATVSGAVPISVSGAGITDLDWLIHLGGSQGEEAWADTVEVVGDSVVIAGAFRAEVDFDPGPGDLPATGGPRFVASYTLGGELEWVTALEDPAVTTWIIDIAAGPDGSIYAAGGLTNFWAGRLNAAGDVLWVHGFTGEGNTRADHTTVDEEGNLTVVGAFFGTVDFDPGAGTAERTAEPQGDIFLLRLDPAGDFLWVRVFGGSARDQATGAFPLPGGGFLLCGETRAFPVSLDGAEVAKPPNGPGFVAEFDATGGLVWYQNYATTGTDLLPLHVVLDPTGNIVVCGDTTGKAQADPTAEPLFSDNTPTVTDGFVAKFERGTGAVLWARSFGGDAGNDSARDVAVLPNGDILVTGRTRNPAVAFSPDLGDPPLPTVDADDAVLLQYSPGGDLLAAGLMGGSGTLQSGYNVAVSGPATVFFSASFQGQIDAHPGLPVALLDSAGASDVFLSRLTMNTTRTPPEQPEIDLLGPAPGEVFILSGDLTPEAADGTDFGVVERGAVASVTFRVHNAGLADLAVTDLSPPAGFTVAEGLDGSIAPGADDTFTLALDAASPGTKTGDVVITSDDPDEASFTFRVTGEVVVNPPVITAQPRDLTVAEGSEATFTLAVTGTAPLAVTWFFNEVEIPGETGLSLTVPAAGLGDVGSYRAEVVNDAGTAASEVALLSVQGPAGRGELVDVRHLGEGEIEDIWVNPDGSYLIAGTLRRNGADFAPDVPGGEVDLNNTSYSDLFVARYEADDTFAWVSTVWGTRHNSGLGVAGDAAGNAYVVGTFDGTVDFAPGVPGGDFAPDNGWDAFLIKFGPGGEPLWFRPVTGPGDNESASAVGVDGDGNVVIAGRFDGATVSVGEAGDAAVLNNPGSLSGFVAKFTPDGDLLWAGGFESGGFVYVTGLAVDGSGDIVVGAFAQGGVDFDPSPAVENPGWNGDFDFYIVKLGSDGAFKWASRFGSAEDDRPEGLSLDVHGNIFVGGFVDGDTNFPTREGNAFYSTASEDGFVSRLGPDGVMEWAHFFGGTTSDRVWGAAAGANGTVAVTGYVRSSSINFNPGPGTSSIDNPDFSEEVWIGVFDNRGNHLWSGSVKGTGTDAGLDVAVMPNGDLLVGGHVENTADFEIGPGVTEITATSSRGIFLARYSGGVVTVPAPAYALDFAGTPVADGDLAPDPGDGTDFGMVLHGTAPVERVFTLTNVGNKAAVLGVGAVAPPAGFTVDGPPEGMLGIGAPADFTLRLETGVRGSFGGAGDPAVIADEDAAASFTFAVAGDVIGPVIEVEGGGMTIADGDAAPDAADGTDFGTVDVNDPPLAHTFTVVNAGDADLHLTGEPRVALSGAGAGSFALTAEPAATIAPGGRADFEVAFDPLLAGGHPATVTIAGDDFLNSEYTFDLAGVAVGSLLTVTGSGDTVDGGDGAVTLREAILAASTNAPAGDAPAGDADGRDVIEFDLGALGDPASITLTAELPEVAGETLIVGPGAGRLTVRAAAPGYRLLAVGAAGELTLDGLRLEGGAPPLGEDGGAVRNAGTLHCFGLVITGASARDGGALFNAIGGTLQVRESSLVNNSATDSGGGVHNAGTLTVIASTVSGNSATSTGGGLHNAGQATITSATLYDNESVDLSGGGVFNGGGAGDLSLQNTIAGGNRSGSGGADIQGNVGTLGFNWVESGIGTNLTDGANNDRVGGLFTPRPPQLGPLTEAGAGLQVHFPLPGSPVIDAGVAAGLGFDQLARPRPFDDPAEDNAAGGDGSEIGAVEVAPELEVLVDAGAAPAEVAFGTVEQGSAAPSVALTIGNRGSARLLLGALGGIELPVPFSLTGGPHPPHLDPSEAAVTFTLTLDTATAGEFAGSLSFPTNDPAGAPFSIALTGTVEGPEITVTGNGQVIVNGDDTPDPADGTDFGTALRGQTANVERTFTIGNDGTEPLALGFPAVDSGDFIITELPPDTLNPGEEGTFTVRLRVSEEGEQTATVSIANGDADENPFTFDLRGVVEAPVLAVLGNAVVIANNDPTPGAADGTLFAPARQGRPAEGTFTIRNDGSAPLNIAGGLVGVSNTTQFSVLPGPGLGDPIGPGETATFTVRLADTSARGTFETQVGFNSNDTENNPFIFAARATVVHPAQLEGLGAPPGSAPVEIPDGDTGPTAEKGTDFGLTLLMGEEPERLFRVTNDGAGTALSLSDLAVPLYVPPGFAIIDDLPPGALAEGESHTFRLRLLSDEAGVKNGNVTFTVDAGGGTETFTFAVSGTVSDQPAGPDIAVFGNGMALTDGQTATSPADGTDFGQGYRDEPGPERSFVIKNLGAQPLSLGATPEPEGFTIVAGTGTAGVVLQPNGEHTLAFRLDTDEQGPVTPPAEVAIPSDDADENPFTFNITGEVLPPRFPEIEVRGEGEIIVNGDETPSAEDGTDLGSVAAGGADLTATFTIHNLGERALQLTVSLPPPDGFSLTDQPAPSVPAGETTTFTVALAAGAVGEPHWDIEITNDDPDENPFRFRVVGEVRGGVVEVEFEDGGGVRHPIADGSITPNTADGTDFGTVPFGGDAVLRSFFLRNTGNETLTFEGDRATAPAGFTVETPPPATLGPGGEAHLTLRLENAPVGSKAGAVLIDTDTIKPRFSFRIRGEVVRAAQTIDFPPLADRVFGEAGFTLLATASSGLPVTFEHVSGPARVDPGGTVSLTGAGEVTVRALQGGDGNYEPATPAVHTFQAAPPATVTGQTRYNTPVRLPLSAWGIPSVVHEISADPTRTAEDPETGEETQLPAGTAAIDPATGEVSFIPAANLIGTATFAYTVDDSVSGTVTTVEVQVVVSAAGPEEIVGEEDTEDPTLINSSDLGSLAITFRPGNVGGGWRLLGSRTFLASNDLLPNLEQGNHRVEFRPAPGFLQPPVQFVDVAPNATTTRAIYLHGNGLAQGLVRPGSVTVHLFPESVRTGSGRAQWRFLGEGDGLWRDSGETRQGVLPGRHWVDFLPVENRTTPQQIPIDVRSGQDEVLAATYRIEHSSQDTVPAPLDFLAVKDANRPSAFAGQLHTSLGYGSGMVVTQPVVLTAAHVVYDDAEMADAEEAIWMFQRHLGDFEPVRQIPRGWFLLGGYAAQRAMEEPGVFSLDSRELDVAALYFIDIDDDPTDGTPGRGGFIGYLSSDLDPNPWLEPSRNKTLIGYPMEGVLDGRKERMHATDNLPFTFTRLGGHTFSSDQFRGFPGMSGGALCVQRNVDGDTGFYPTAVYLGGADRAVVRAIDSEVVELITRATVAGLDGDASSTGGIIKIPAAFPSLTNQWQLTVDLGPEGELPAGAGWHLVGSEAHPVTDALYDQPVFHTAGSGRTIFTIVFLDVPGFFTPPRLTFDAGRGDGVTVNRRYLPTDSGEPPASAIQVRLEDEPAGGGWRLGGDVDPSFTRDPERTIADTARAYRVEFARVDGWIEPMPRRAAFAGTGGSEIVLLDGVYHRAADGFPPPGSGFWPPDTTLADRLPGGDADGDGVNNLVQVVLGAGAASPSGERPALGPAQREGGGGSFQVPFTFRHQEFPGVVVQLQRFTFATGTWDTVATFPAPAEGGDTRQTNTLLPLDAAGDPLFLRLHLNYTPPAE